MEKDMKRGDGMKIAKGFAVLFAVVGAVLMLGAVGLCLGNLNTPARVAETPVEVTRCGEELMQALAAGDYAAAQNSLYGQPDLGAGETPSDPTVKLFWEAFTRSFSYEFNGECYVTDSGYARSVTVTTLDLSAAAADLKARARKLLEDRVASASEMTELYDETGEFREDLISQVLSQAAQEAAAGAVQTVTSQGTLSFYYRDGQWWAIPDQALLKAISGGVA